MGFAARYAELHIFAAKTLQTVESRREKFSTLVHALFTRARGHVRCVDPQTGLGRKALWLKVLACLE